MCTSVQCVFQFYTVNNVLLSMCLLSSIKYTCNVCIYNVYYGRGAPNDLSNLFPSFYVYYQVSSTHVMCVYIMCIMVGEVQMI